MGLKVCQICAVDFTLKHFLLPLIDGMQDAGWEVTSVCSDGPAVSELRSRGYRIETIDIARSYNLLQHVRSIWALIRFFKKHKFDVLHVHTPVAALIGRIAAKWVGIPTVVYTAHGFYFHDEMPSWKRRIFVFLERIGGYLTHLLFTQSTEDAAAAVREGIFPAERVLAIGNGVDPSRFNPSLTGDSGIQRRDLGIPEDAFVIGIIARLVQEKGVSEFLEAAVESAKSKDNLYFLMVGERLVSDHAGHVASDLERASAFLGKRLILTGSRADIPDLLNTMDVFCLPSWREGMPRTIIEAMMMGKAVIATNIRGSREEVLDEETGILVPTRSPKALTEAMLRCASDPNRTKAMGASGRSRALKLYDERHVVALQVDRIARYQSRPRKSGHDDKC